MIFGRTDIRIGVSRAKFDEEIDFEIDFTPAPQKINKNREKLMFQSNKFANFQKFSECVRTHPNASECIRMHPNGSECIRTGPSKSNNIEKPTRLRKNFEKLQQKF